MTFYYHQFVYGLCFPLHPFILAICRHYHVPVNQLNPNAVKYIVCFYIVCVSVDVEPVPEFFAQYFTIKLGPDIFYVTANVKDWLIGEIATKIKFWKSKFFYVKSDSPWPFDHTILTETPQVAPPASGFEVVKSILGESISPLHYNIERMIRSEDLLSRAGLLPIPFEEETNWSTSFQD